MKPTPTMKNNKVAGTALILLSLVLFLLTAIHVLRVPFWLASPAQKMQIAWNEDTQLLEQSGKLPKEWGLIKEISVRADNSLVQDWLKELRHPMKSSPNGTYRLETFITFWIENFRYGVVLQYHLVDIKSQNTIWEDGRTYKLGIVY